MRCSIHIQSIAIMMAVVILGSGCASIRMNVDVYNGNLVIPTDTNSEQENLSFANEIDHNIDQRIGLATFVRDLQKEFSLLLKPQDTDFDDIRYILTGARNYLERMESLKAELHNLPATGSGSSDRLKRIYDASAEHRNTAFEGILSNLKSDAVGWIYDNLSTITNRDVSPEDYENFREKLNESIDKLEATDREFREIAENMRDKNPNDTRDSAKLARSIINLSKIVETSDLLNSIREQEIRSQILSRSEDYGDSIWRKLTSEHETGNWKTVFGTTRWHAKGKSSVIIAKESPINFRIHQGKNDPKALVRGQLAVARNLSDLALAVGASKLGVNLGSADLADTQPETLSLAAQATNADYVKSMRQKYQILLQEKLTESILQLKKAKPDGADISQSNVLYHEIIESLKSYKLALASLIQ